MSHPYKTNLYFSTDLILQIYFLLLENIIKRGTVFLNLKDELHLTSMKQDTGAFFFFLDLTAFTFLGVIKTIVLSCCLARLNVELWT